MVSAIPGLRCISTGSWLAYQSTRFNWGSVPSRVSRRGEGVAGSKFHDHRRSVRFDDCLSILVSADRSAIACETYFRLATLDPAPTTMSRKLVLASGSPRRRQLLSAAGLSFELVESGVEERRQPQEPAREYALRMAQTKALAVARRLPDSIVLGADTVVECEAEILEKPVDAADAQRMLTLLAGRGHVVITAFAVAHDRRLIETEAVESEVFFRPLSETEIHDYIASGEPFDKAGAYGIQGIGGSFISRVDGPRDNVMGLPVEKVLAALERCGVTRPT